MKNLFLLSLCLCFLCSCVSINNELIEENFVPRDKTICILPYNSSDSHYLSKSKLKKALQNLGFNVFTPSYLEINKLQENNKEVVKWEDKYGYAIRIDEISRYDTDFTMQPMIFISMTIIDLKENKDIAIIEHKGGTRQTFYDKIANKINVLWTSQ